MVGQKAPAKSPRAKTTGPLALQSKSHLGQKPPKNKLPPDTESLPKHFAPCDKMPPKTAYGFSQTRTTVNGMIFPIGKNNHLVLTISVLALLLCKAKK